MTTPEKAAAWAKAIAYDDSHGYDQSSRWGLTTIVLLSLSPHISRPESL